MGRWVRRGQWLEYTVAAAQAGLPVRELLTEHLHVSLRLQKELLGRAGVLLGRELCRPEDRVAAGDRVALAVLIPEPYGMVPEPVPFGVLYEDEHLLVADKPAGILVHPPDSGTGGTLAHGVAYHYQLQGLQTRVRHIHRLDVDTTGAVLFAKHALAHVLLDAALARHQIGRQYIAVVAGYPSPPRGTLRGPLGRDRHHAGRFRVSPGGVPAVTHYQVLEQYTAAALVQLTLETGRTHQIRVHMSHAGHPLLGDRLYGGPDAGIARQALHGGTLFLAHPFSGEQVTLTAPWPADLQDLIAGLRRAGRPRGRG